MTLSLIVITAVIAQACCMPTDFDERIYMPGEYPVVFEIDNDGETRAVTYDNPSDSHPRPVSPPRGIPHITEIGERACGVPFGTIGYNNTCQRLLTRGPCANSEWLVKPTNAVEGKCVKRSCRKGQLLYEGKCVKVSHRSVCSEGQMLYVDFTGKVHCDCEPDYFYDPWQGQCFTQHDRASCNFGYFLQVTERGDVQCVPNPCHMEGFAYNNNTKKCHRKMYRGICESPSSLKWHHENSTAECIAYSPHSVFDLPTLRSCPPGSVRDLLQRCREEYRVPVDTIYLSSYGRCELGFVKDARGICRKTHRLFG